MPARRVALITGASAGVGRATARATRQAAGWPAGAGWLRLGGASAGIIVMTAVALAWKRHRRA